MYDVTSTESVCVKSVGQVEVTEKANGVWAGDLNQLHNPTTIQERSRLYSFLVRIVNMHDL